MGPGADDPLRSVPGGAFPDSSPVSNKRTDPAFPPPSDGLQSGEWVPRASDFERPVSGRRGICSSKQDGTRPSSLPDSQFSLSGCRPDACVLLCSAISLINFVFFVRIRLPLVSSDSGDTRDCELFRRISDGQGGFLNIGLYQLHYILIGVAESSSRPRRTRHSISGRVSTRSLEVGLDRG